MATENLVVGDVVYLRDRGTQKTITSRDAQVVNYRWKDAMGIEHDSSCDVRELTKINPNQAETLSNLNPNDGRGWFP